MDKPGGMEGLEENKYMGKWAGTSRQRSPGPVFPESDLGIQLRKGLTDGLAYCPPLRPLYGWEP